MSRILQDPVGQRSLADPGAPEPPQVRLGRPGPEARWLALPETTPLLLTGADLGAHRTIRWLLGDWVQTLAATGDADVMAWAEMDIFMDSGGLAGLSVTPSLGMWLAALRRAYTQGVARPTVFVGYEVTGTPSDDLLAEVAGQPLEGPGWHVIWGASPDSAGGRLASALPWRTRIEVEADARHVELSRPGLPPERLTVAWDRN